MPVVNDGLEHELGYIETLTNNATSGHCGTPQTP